MKFPPFLHSHLRLTLLGTPPNRVFFLSLICQTANIKAEEVSLSVDSISLSCQSVKPENLRSVAKMMRKLRSSVENLALGIWVQTIEVMKC